MPVPFGSCACPSPTSRATSFSTPVMRSALKPSPPRVAGAGQRAGCASRSSRNCSGSLPAACASSSMNDWNTNAKALLPGARSAPVGTPSGIIESPSAKFGTKRAGNSVAPRSSPSCANALALAEGDEVVRHATSLPAGVDAALEEVEAAGPVEVVAHVVFARPQQLDRHAAPASRSHAASTT